jgi:hypothetical protein
LAKSLSERTAFILSSEPDTREKIAELIRKFYKIRSRTVHGSKVDVSIQTLEAVDKMIILLCLVIGFNHETWKTDKELKKWCDEAKWGKASYTNLPFPKIYLSKSIDLLKE